jgi:hypothetical protein
VLDRDSAVDSSALLDAAGKWLRDQGCEIVCIEENVATHDVTTWGRTMLQLGSATARMSVNAYMPSLRMVRTAFRHGNKIQLKSKALDQALAPYAATSQVVGVKLGRLSQGNTRVMPLVLADDLTPDAIRRLCDGWIEAGPALQKIGRAPGQTLGEVTVGLYALGIQGFRIEQPAEIYPIFVYLDETRFAAAREQLVDGSVRELVHKRNSVGAFVLPKAPVFLQAVFVSVPSRTVATNEAARETRRAWRHYKKPKLAGRAFRADDLLTVLSAN